MDLEGMDWKEEINGKWGENVRCVVIPKLHGKEAVNVPRSNINLGEVFTDIRVRRALKTRNQKPEQS